MAKYKFFIEAYYADKKDYLEIDEYEKELFKYNGKTVKIKTLNSNKKIKEAQGIELECEYFSDIKECIETAKKAYVNFLISLNNTCISYILDKASMGNFTEYCKDEDAELYSEIVIENIEDKDKGIYGFIESEGTGCTHFYLNEFQDMKIDQKLKDSLMINNYRKSLLLNNIHSLIDNTLVSSSIEMLLDKEDRSKEELDIINEVVNYLDIRYKETENKTYNLIKQTMQNNKHKSIKKRIEDLVKKHSTMDNEKENINIIKKISKNRTKEIHVSSKDKPDTVYSWGMLNKIQMSYAKDLYESSKSNESKLK